MSKGRFLCSVRSAAPSSPTAPSSAAAAARRFRGGASSVGAASASNAPHSSQSPKKLPILPIAVGVASAAVVIGLFVVITGVHTPKDPSSAPAAGDTGSSQTAPAPEETEKPFEGFVELEGTNKFGTSKVFGLDFGTEEAAYQEYQSDGTVDTKVTSNVSSVTSGDNYWIYQVAQHETSEDWDTEKTGWMSCMLGTWAPYLEDVSLSLFAPKTFEEGHEGTFGYFASGRFIEDENTGEYSGKYYLSFYIVDLHADGTFDGRRSFIRTDWPAGSFDYLDPASDSFDSEHVFTADEVGDTSRDKGLVFSGTWTCSDNSLLQLTQN